jgi:hypothetical protein
MILISRSRFRRSWWYSRAAAAEHVDEAASVEALPVAPLGTLLQVREISPRVACVDATPHVHVRRRQCTVIIIGYIVLY